MDILQDRGYIRLLSIKTAYPGLVPAFVDSADLAEIKTAATSLGVSEFANDIAREYPLGDKAQIWLAAAYFTKSAADMQLGPEMREYVWARIKSAAETYDMLDEVEKVASVLGAEKQAETEEHWGWSDNAGKKYPLHTAELTKTAMAYFGKNRDKYPFAMRREIAGNIYKRASALNLDITETTRKEAGIGYPDRFAAAAAIEDRCARLREKFPAMAEKLAAYADGIKVANADELMSAVDSATQALEAADKTAGFYYSGKGAPSMLVERPIDLMYSIDHKTACVDSQRYITLNQNMFDCVKLAMTLDPETYDAPLGPDFLRNAIPKVAGFQGMEDSQVLFNVLSALPKQDKAALETHLKSL